MNENENSIPDKTLESMARGFFRESTQYGFKKMDFVRFVNYLLDIALKNSQSLENHTNHQNIKPPDVQEPITKLPIRTERLIIREFQKRDIPLVKGWLKDQAGRRFLLSRSTSWHINVEKIKKNVVIGIITLTDETPIGAVAYLDIDKRNHRAEIRKIIGDVEKRGMGYAKEATKAWINYGVNAFGLGKIYLNTLDTNIRNIRLNEEIGFMVEGILRNEVYFDDEYHDVLRMGMFIER